MKKIVAVFINNKGTSEVDVSNLKNGNPGMGGTQFEFFILLNELKKQNKYKIVYFGTAIQKGLNEVETVVVNDIYDAFKKCNELNVNILISRDGGSDRLDLLNKTKLIYWVHNFVPYEFCKNVGKNNKVKRVVFVSHQHRDFYLEMDVAKKAEVIYNSFYLQEKIEVTNDKTNTAIFIGNIVPIKKLHVITKLWPSIVKKVPDAKLIVVGTGQTANRSKKLGPKGIAEEQYENKVLEPLLKTNTLNSIQFMGVLGGEKVDLIRKSKLAFAPNDKETFCISALEYALAGTPVVGVSKGGITDVIRNGKSGILCKTTNGIKKHAIKIFKNKESFKCLPEEMRYFKTNFDVDVFINKWMNVIEEVENDIKPHKIKAKWPYSDKFKYIGFVLKFFRIIFHLPDGFSRVGIAARISRWKNHG